MLSRQLQEKLKYYRRVREAGENISAVTKVSETGGVVCDVVSLYYREK